MKLLFEDLGQTESKVKGGSKKTGKKGLVGLGFTFVLNQAKLNRAKITQAVNIPGSGKLLGSAKVGKSSLQKSASSTGNAWDLMGGEIGQKKLPGVLHKKGERSAAFSGLKQRLGLKQKAIMFRWILDTVTGSVGRF